MYYRSVLITSCKHASIAVVITSLTLGAVLRAEPNLLSAQEALDRIRLQPLPPCQDALRLVAAKRDDATFLSRRLREAGWGKVGREYVLSLNDLAYGLFAAAKGRPSEESCERIRLILNDLHVKRRDCERLGHSRTDIPVEISTTRGRSAVSGLEVYLRWIPAGDHFDTEPKRLRDFSSPARGTVPIPGEFEVFAKDPSSGESSEPERLSIGGVDVFRWQLQVRFRASP
jgi:hypothetical protein